MKKIQFSEIFSVDYLSMILKHRERIQDLIRDYDVVIFMARKAICFYKAMVVNAEIEEDSKCMVLSSRVLSYNISSLLKGKRIAIVDDVVVRGKSLSYSKEILESYGIDADIHFMACEKDFFDNVKFKSCIKSPFIYLSEISIYQLSSYITEYIEASMVPYNIDQPIYTIAFDNIEKLNDTWMKINNITNIADGLQNKFGISNLTVHFKSDSLKTIIGDEINTEEVFLKIRFLQHTKNAKVIAIPFVLLPKISYVELDELYKRCIGSGLDRYIAHSNKREQYENKLKIVQYILSDILFLKYIRDFCIENVEKDFSNEFVQFAVLICNYALISEHIIETTLTFANQVNSINSHFEFDEYLSCTYDYIFGSEISKEMYYDGRRAKELPEIITFHGLINYLKNIWRNVEKYAVSSLVDILIDKGILVPAIVHGKDNSLIRGYKCGEIYNLTKKGIKLFGYMLDMYAKSEKNVPLGKVELEKLCVLFFKNTAYKNRLFCTSKTFDDDCFAICYSKFGPRVSDSCKKYKVNSKSALVSVLEEENVFFKGDKYHIEQAEIPIDLKWKIIAENFALSYVHLRQCFEEEKIQYKFVRSYSEFLTLLAIGPDKKNQMFSLMAELYLITRIDMDATLSEILNEMDKTQKDKYLGIMDGINSGMWKYACFCEKDMIDEIFNKASNVQSDIRYIKEEYLTSIGENDENPIYAEMIEQCGSLLYEVAYLFNYAQKRYTDEDLNKVLKRTVFYNKQFSSMRHAIKTICETASEEEIIKDLKELKKRAQALINECDLCIEEAAFKAIRVYNDIFVIYHPDNVLTRNGSEIKLQNSQSNSIIEKCIFIKGHKEEEIGEQLLELINEYDIYSNNALIIYMDIENSYEGLFDSQHMATGDYFKNLVICTTQKCDYDSKDALCQVVWCSRGIIKEQSIQCKGFKLIANDCGEVYDEYKFMKYFLVREERTIMTNGTCNGGFTINNPIFNGTVGAIGTNNTVNINTHNKEETFYSDIQKMDVQKLGQNTETVRLIEAIKAEAENKNKKGVLVKLRELAEKVGGSVFTKLVSSVIVDVMKDNGYFPF